MARPGREERIKLYEIGMKRAGLGGRWNGWVFIHPQGPIYDLVLQDVRDGVLELEVVDNVTAYGKLRDMAQMDST